jgi:hypothetical protein
MSFGERKSGSNYGGPHPRGLLLADFPRLRLIINFDALEACGHTFAPSNLCRAEFGDP